MLEGLLKEQICNDPTMAAALACYKGRPAFFYQASPPDTDRGWFETVDRQPLSTSEALPRACYPRADYIIDMRHDPEHKTSGTLTINVWCAENCKQMPEDIEKRLVELIDGTFYTHGDNRPSEWDPHVVCAVWKVTEPFMINTRLGDTKGGPVGDPEIFGITITYDLTRFPAQITSTPDPILAMNAWTKRLFPDVTLITYEHTPTIWKPDDIHPAIYWRFVGIDATSRQSYAVNWYTGHFTCHVIADNVTQRNSWLKAIVEQIQLYGEIILLDDSPMFVHQLTIRHNADPLRDGQLSLILQYGVLAQQRKEHASLPLNYAHYGAARPYKETRGSPVG